MRRRDQVKGSIEDAAGKVQEKTGQVIGSTEQQRKGISKQDGSDLSEVRLNLALIERVLTGAGSGETTTLCGRCPSPPP
jgi:uncharacterized protein YjbJ (UPF0337 family)